MSAVAATIPPEAEQSEVVAAPAAVSGSVLSQGAAEVGSAVAAVAATAGDWMTQIPDKYVVKGADGSVDPSQSVPKLAQAYNELMKRMVAGEAPPADENAYDVKELPHGVDFAELKKDEKFRTWLKGAHSKGMSNAQVQHAMEGLSEFIVGEMSYTADEGAAALREVWKTDEEFKSNANAAWRAANAAAQKAGVSFAELDAAFGNNPMWLRVMASLGKEMAEDRSPGATGWVPSGDLESQIKAVRTQLDAMPVHDRARPALQDKLMVLYNAKTPNGARRAGAFTG